MKNSDKNAAAIVATESKVVYENDWMSVREDKIQRSSGAAGIYGVVEKPDFSVIVPLEGRTLTLVEQFRYPVGARYWEFPQGSSSDPSITEEQLARAELREETGLVASSLVHIGRHFPSYGFATQAYDIYLATELDQQERQLDAEEEDLICQNFSIEQVEQMIIEGVIKDAVTVAAFGLLRLKNLI